MTDAIVRLATALSGRYRIEHELGQGGMATVYLAEDLRHKRKVAVKVLRPELASAIGPDRFLREIETTAGLRHPHILPLFDSGEADGFLYYVMPLVEGASLRDRLDRDKQLSLEDALQIAGEIADALGYAHGRGVIHRDIKPENVLLEGGHAVVADFGIARAVGSASSLTQTGMAIGTPAYMSPEQAAGDTVDGRSDLYALGCVTFEMLAGQPPFTGPTVESVVHQHLGAEPRLVTQIRSAVPAGVAQAVQRALAKNPADRFSTPAAFSAALRASPAAMRSRPGRVAAIVAGVVALVIAVGGWLALSSNRSSVRLDANVIAVLPFRVGGDAATAYLRESMLDLLNARLTGESGPRLVEPRTALSAWRRAGGAPGEDLTEDDSRSVAAALGAGRLLLGSAISTPTELTLSGSLIDVANGAVVANGSVAGAPDSIAVLVNRLTARLLSLGAGESRERLDGLAATSLEALQDYLAGRAAYRRGDYNGAMDLFARALGRDSGFVDAAFGMVASNPYIGTVLRVDGMQVIPLVWRLRERMSPRDRALFLGMPFVGPNFPRASTYAEVIAQAERAATEAPDSPEHWLSLGTTLLQYGAVASVTDWENRGAAALDRAIALDSSFTPAVTIRLYVPPRSPAERASYRRLETLLEASVAAGFADATILWAAAVQRGDSAAARRWLEDSGESPLNRLMKLVKVPLHAAQFGLPLADGHRANTTLRAEGLTEQQRNAAWLGERAVAFAEGRLQQDVGLWGPYLGDWTDAGLIRQALVESAYLPLARGRARGLQASQWLPTRDCYGELLRVSAGDSSRTRQAVQRLRAFATQSWPPVPDAIWGSLEFRVCPLLLEALLEGGGPTLDSLEAVMRDGPRWLNAVGPPTTPVVEANWVIARLREAQGNIPAALAAIRRREVSYYPAYLWTLPAFLRQEGRLAALAGDTAGAMSAYDRYLTLRTNPDPPFQPQRDSVIAERTALVRR